MTRSRTIAVYGATGYTGRRVATELLARGCRVLLAGRDRAALSRLEAELGGDVSARYAALDDLAAVGALCREAAAIINCAGPFSVTARPLATAAIVARTHYLDVSAEQGSALWLCEEAAPAAVAAGVVLLPAFAFYSALSDMLAALTARGFGAIDDLDVAYRITEWRPPAASFRSRIDGLDRAWFVYDEGLEAVHEWPRTTWFDFAAPIGRTRMSAYPTADVILIPRHIEARRVTALLSAATLAPAILGPLLPVVANAARVLLRTPAKRMVEAFFAALWRSSATDGKTRDPTTFDVAVRVRGGGRERRSQASGRGIYDLSARIVADAAVRVAATRPHRFGVVAPAELIDPRTFLDGLAADGVRYVVDAECAAA
jgi:short subunit dehydrogenase-like uncharacterized protein